jgi:hypothetical protein
MLSLACIVTCGADASLKLYHHYFGRGSHSIVVAIKDPYRNKITESFIMDSKDLLVAKTNNDKEARLLVNDLSLADSLVFQVTKRWDLFSDGLTSSQVQVFSYVRRGKTLDKYSEASLFVSYDGKALLPSGLTFDKIAGVYNYDLEVTKALNPVIKWALARQVVHYSIEQVEVTCTNVVTGKTTNGAGFLGIVKELASEKKNRTK